MIVPSRFDFYIQCSRKMMTLLEEYTPDHEKFSIDETFLDMTDTEIAKYMNLVRSTIHHHRVSSLKSLKKIMEEIKTEEKK